MRETLIIGGTIRPRSSAESVEALLLRDGRVAAAGSEDACRRRALSSPDAVDLQGRVVLPGFVDAHCHPLMLGQFLSWVPCDWESAPSIDEVVESLADDARRHRGAVRGQGFHHGNVAERRMLTRHDLDRVATDREVLVFHSSGHGAIVNSWTLDARGISAATPDPSGGHFGREADGTPDGTVWDAAADWLTGPRGVKITNNGPNFHLPDEDDALDRQLLLGQQAFLAKGVTTVVDAQVTSRELSTYLRVRNRGELRLRSEMLIISSLLEQLESLGIVSRLGDDRLAVSGVKLYADGALTAATARWSAPYCCSPDDLGYLYHPNDELEGMIARVVDLGLVAATHAQGDAAIQVVLDTFDALGGSAAGVRHRIEHCGGPTPEQVRRIAELGLWPVTQPQYLRRYGDELLNALGERASRATPLGELRDAGVPLVLSSDAPVCPPGPLEAVSAAVTRRTLGGQVLGGPELTVSVEEALAGHTLGAAASIGREHELGSLETGKLADLVVLDADPLGLPVEELTEIAVLETWVSGSRVFGATPLATS